MTETFHGYIETTQDVLLVFEGCRRGLLPRVRRRLQEKERKMIQSGSVFVFDERESGIKRWTDGFIWSPSRILGNFLIYRELDKRSSDKKLSLSSVSGADARQRSYSADQTSSSAIATAVATATSDISDRNRERRLVGSLSDSYKFRKDGLVKKTMAIVVNGVSQHLISYYNPEDILQNRLRTPSSVPELAGLEISPDLLVKHNFRIPPVVEPAFDENDPMQGHFQNEAYDRRVHPLRSMSVGSVRSSDHFQSTVPRPDMMYSSSYAHQQRMELENAQKHSPTMSYGNQPMPIMYTPGYPAIPSPTGMSSSMSSPGTPMLSPARPSYQHQRHYSTSSVSSNSLPSPLSRVERNSYDMMSMHSTHGDRRQAPQHCPPSSSFGQVHPHMISSEYSGDHRMPEGALGLEERQQRFATNPNIGQLLNPVHPLHRPPLQESNSNSQALLHSMALSQPPSYSDYPMSNVVMQDNQRNSPREEGYNYAYYDNRPMGTLMNNGVPLFQNGVLPTSHSM